MIDSLSSAPSDVAVVFGTIRKLPDKIDTTMDVAPLFEVPNQLAHGQKFAKIWVRAGGRDWRSSAFILDFSN